MLCDYYELTMANGYYRAGMSDSITYFDMFFRDIPDGGGFAIAAGLEQLIEYINNLEFTDEDIEYLRSKNVFDEAFLEKLKTFRFTGDIYAIPEGTPIFPGEPIITVRAPAAEAQFIETYLLLTVNHQSLIATKANRIVRAAKGRAISEFGSRRAQGADGAYLGARAAPPPPARSQIVTSAFRRPARWRTPGCRCSTANTRHSRPTANSTPPTQRCWWTPTTP